MKTRNLIAALLLLSITAIAQEKKYQIEEISYINYGDNRILFRELNEEKTPLQGENRIIDGRRSEYILATFKDGMYHGNYKHFKNNILHEESNYNEGRIDGVQKKYNFQGLITSSAEFSDGKLNGVYTTYYQNGKIETEQEFKMGIEHGFCYRYDKETGKRTSETYYNNGKNDGTWIQHISGNRVDYIEYSQFKDGILIGEFSRKTEDGIYILKGFYKNGKKDGEWIIQDADGTPREMVTYNEGTKNGPFKYYYSNGSLREEGKYKNDQIVSSVRYHTNGEVVE